jgi:hypothetical protein
MMTEVLIFTGMSSPLRFGTTQSQLDDLTPSRRPIRWRHHLFRALVSILPRIICQDSASRRQTPTIADGRTGAAQQSYNRRSASGRVAGREAMGHWVCPERQLSTYRCANGLATEQMTRLAISSKPCQKFRANVPARLSWLAGAIQQLDYPQTRRSFGHSTWLGLGHRARNLQSANSGCGELRISSRQCMKSAASIVALHYHQRVYLRLHRPTR